MLSRDNRKFSCVLAFCLPGLLQAQTNDFFEMDFEDLMKIEVSVASRKEQSLSQTPAAVSVVSSQEAIQAGATNILEALRLVPGIHVAQISSAEYAVSVRGFNGLFSNKLLVLIDGRSIYNATFSGVYWEVHDLPLELVDRIEVIRGPGASLWGSNAVNGVINIITKHASETEGAQVVLEAGSETRAGTLVWGREVSSNSSVRLHAKVTEREDYRTITGEEMDNELERSQIGFRFDGLLKDRDKVLVTANITQADYNQHFNLPDLSNPPAYTSPASEPANFTQKDLTLRWTHSPSVASEVILQTFWDHYRREDSLRNETASTLDVDLQYSLNLDDAHNIVWGLGYRRIDLNVDSNSPLIQVIDKEDDLSIKSVFLQDEIELVDDFWYLTLGIKVEDHDFADVEWQPSIRALWTPTQTQTFWLSASKAVRTPSYGERSVRVTTAVLPPTPGSPTPFPIKLDSISPGLDSEVLLAYEFGYRSQVTDNLSLDSALFINDYDKLALNTFTLPTFEAGPPPHLLALLPLTNELEATAKGLELYLNWAPVDKWRTQLGFSAIKSDFSLKSGQSTAQDQNTIKLYNTRDPDKIISLLLTWLPRTDVDVSFLYRHVSSAVPLASGFGSPTLAEIDAYNTLDFRAAWRLDDNIELALVGKNLLDNDHLEWVSELYPVAVQIPRSVLMTLRMQF